MEASWHAAEKGLAITDGTSSMAVVAMVYDPLALATLYMVEAIMSGSKKEGDTANPEMDTTGKHAEKSSYL